MRQENAWLKTLRELAKKYKKTNNCSHCQALDAIAKEIGYKNWARLIEKENV